MKIRAKAIIFDQDGVIIDTDTLAAQSINYGFKKIGITINKNEIPLIAGKSIDALKEFLLMKWNFNFEEFREIQRKFFYDNLEKAPYFTKTINFIKELYLKNKTLALTTSAGIEGTLIILKKIEIFNMFKVIVTKDDCTKSKPDPEPYLLTAKKLGISPQDCIVIEDSSIGVAAAKSANMRCIAMPNKHTKNQDFSLADYVSDSINDIKRHINLC